MAVETVDSAAVGDGTGDEAVELDSDELDLTASDDSDEIRDLVLATEGSGVETTATR